MDLDGFRPHNAAHAPSNEGFFAPSNGKNDFDEDLDDLGPETDVDAVDEVQSPVKLIAGMSEELEEKVTKEIDANLLKSVVENCTDSNLEHDEDDEHDELAGVERKEETPTPPADDGKFSRMHVVLTQLSLETYRAVVAQSARSSRGHLFRESAAR